jgi:hypothetical protein
MSLMTFVLFTGDATDLRQSLRFPLFQGFQRPNPKASGKKKPQKNWCETTNKNMFFLGEK